MAKQQPVPFPAAGYIKGGMLNRWRFHFLQFSASAGGLVLIARCTPMYWPFPADIRMTHVHFETLESFAKDNVRTLDACVEIKAAYQRSRLEPPDLLFTEPLVLRDVLQRSYQTTASPLP